MEIFRQYASDLDQHYEKYEKITKISRDITFERFVLLCLDKRISNQTSARRPYSRCKEEG